MAYLQANAEEIWLEVDSTAKRLALEDPREIDMTDEELDRLEHDTLDELGGVMYRAALLRMLPAPRQKPAQISPIFISDKVTLHVSREKGGKLRLVYAGWDDAKVVQPNGCGGWILPPGRGSDDPPSKTRPPLRCGFIAT